MGGVVMQPSYCTPRAALFLVFEGSRYLLLVAREAVARAAAANSSLPRAVPAIPHPPSAGSVSSTQVRDGLLGSPESFVTISVISRTSCFCPSRERAAGGVIIWTRTVRAAPVAAVWT